MVVVSIGYARGTTRSWWGVVLIVFSVAPLGVVLAACVVASIQFMIVTRGLG